MTVINSVKLKASVFVKGTDSCKCTSLFYYGINYGRKKFYDTGPGTKT